jgi:sugar O-acyltransferase (sialic acid O-acetyltransferase NeuD family)
VSDVIALARAQACDVVVALGDNAVRRRLQLQLLEHGVSLATIVHPRACLLAGARLGAGSMILAGAVVGIDAQVGAGAIINTSVSVDHDNSVGDFAHLSPGVHTGGEVRIGEGTHLAVGVSVRNRISIGEWSLVGVGAAVVSDLPARVVAYGVPARIVRTLG